MWFINLIGWIWAAVGGWLAFKTLDYATDPAVPGTMSGGAFLFWMLVYFFVFIFPGLLLAAKR